MNAWTAPRLPAGIGGDTATFVGRRSELEQMEGIWAAVEEGNRQVVFVGGEPGAGKSRLMAEIAQAVHRHGATVLWGACYADYDVPYRPFATAIDELLSGIEPGTLADILTDDAARLVPLTPQITRHLPPDVPLPPRHDTQRPLFEAVTGFLAALTSHAPVVLVLDDVHWAGPPTVQLLKHVVRHSGGVPLLLLVSYRTTAPDRSDEVSYAVSDLYPLEGVTRIDLAGLGADDIADYLVSEARMPRRRALGSATMLRDQTGGNPFFLREMWRDIAHQGGIAALRSPTFQAPSTVRDTLDRRLAGFAPAHADVIELAAVAGERIGLPTLLASSTHSREVTLAAIDMAVAAGLLADDPAAPATYTFRHALARQAVLDRLAPSARAALHARIAEALAHHDRDDPWVTARLAYHYEAAHALGYEQEAVTHLVRAAVHAERTVAHEQAADLFTRAAALPATTVRPRNELLLSAAHCRVRAGDFVAATEIAERLVVAGNAEIALQAAVLHEDASWRPGFDGQRSLELLEEALRRHPGPERDPLRIRALASTSRALSFTGQQERARTVGDQALRLARDNDDEQLLAHALGCTLWWGMTPGLAPTLLDRAAELCQLGQGLGEGEHLGPGAFYRAVFGYMLGRPGDWLDGCRDLEIAARRGGEPFFRYVQSCSDYARNFAQGHYDAAERVLGSLASFDDEFGAVSTEGSHGVQTFMLHRATGRLGEVRRYVTGDEPLATHWAPGLLALYVELGLTGPAARVLEHLLEHADGYRQVSAQWAGVLAFAVDASMVLGSRSAAEQLRPLLEPYAGMNLMTGQFVALFGSADRYLAGLDSLLERPDVEDRFEAALDLDRRMRASTHQIETLLAWADHLDRSRGADAGDRAGNLRAEARALADRTGWRRRQPGGTDLPQTSALEELTPREREVLRLVADGLSNREIGDRLFISQNTAANHVRSILMKVDAPNRTKAAMYAAEHGLLVDD